MLVTKKAPDFTAEAVLGNNEIVNNLQFNGNLGEKGCCFILLSFRLYICMSI